jgi:ribosome-binding protein aMBF1 (putative translation factor)
MSLTTELQKAIETSGLSLYRIAKDSGISYSVLHRFANNERQVKLDAGDKLAEYFGMRLTKPQKPKRF